MKTASPGLVTHLTSGQQFRRAELWTFSLVDGTVLRYTQLDTNVKVGSDTWLANGPVLTRPRARQVAGVEVDEFEITIAPGPGDLIGGQTWPVVARKGGLRDGRVLIERVYMPTWGDVSLGKLYTQGGVMVRARGDGSEVIATVWSDLMRLNTKIPIDVQQAGCRHTLFDAKCTLSAAAFAVSGTVASGSTASSIHAVLGQATGYFSLGRIVFTSGPNIGASRSIKLHTSGSPAIVKLVIPMFNAPVVGDAFTIYPGCDKTQATCNTKFANQDNFGGEPYVPVPETAL